MAGLWNQAMTDHPDNFAHAFTNAYMEHIESVLESVSEGVGMAISEVVPGMDAMGMAPSTLIDMDGVRSRIDWALNKFTNYKALEVVHDISKDVAFQQARASALSMTAESGGRATWVRVASPSGCGFCLNASNESLGGPQTQWKSHGNCNCLPEILASPDGAEAAIAAYSAPSYLDDGRVTELRDRVANHKYGSVDGAKTFPTGEAGRDWAAYNVATPEVWNASTPEMRDAWDAYANPDYKQINGYARHGAEGLTRWTPEEAQAAIDGLDAGFGIMPPIPEAIQVTREARAKHALPGFDIAVDDPSSLIGREFVDPGYMSTSLNAVEGSQAGLSDHDVRIRFTVPKGTVGTPLGGDMNGENMFGGPDADMFESEFLLPRNTRWRITAARQEPDRLEIWAEIIPEGGR